LGGKRHRNEAFTRGPQRAGRCCVDPDAVERGDIVAGAGTILDDTLLADAFRQPLRD
jgi:hypothetical protein